MSGRVSAAGQEGLLRNNTVWALVADVCQLVLGLASFFILARVLGTEEFGRYAAVIAVSTLTIPVFSFGAQQLIMLDMEQGRSFEALWQRGASTVLFGGLFATALGTLVVRPILIPELSWLDFAALFGAQSVFFGMAEFSLVSTRAHRRLDVSAALRAGAGSVRLAAVIAFATTGGASTAEYAWFSLTGWSVAALLSMLIVHRAFAAQPVGAVPAAEDLRRGFPYAVGAGSAFALDAIDRPMLLRISGPSENGVYAAGYRVVQMAITPIGALVKASEADFFSAGAEGSNASYGIAKRMSRVAALYGVVAGLAIFFAAPLLPVFLGDDWNETVTVARFLAFLPLVKALQIFAANALTGQGLQHKRNRALQIAVVVNIVANLALMPRFGWRGASVATLAAEVMMVALLWRAVHDSRSSSSQRSSELK